MLINFLWTLAAFGLLLLNALFVAAEFGMVKLRDTRVEEIKGQNGLRGRLLSQIHTHLDTYLSACQVGITLASLGLGWIGEPAFSGLITPVLQYLGVLDPNMVRLLSVAFGFILISFLHIVVGELMPKSMAIRRAEQVSLWTAVPLYGFYWLMYPAIRVLNACSNALLRMGGLDIHQHQAAYSSDEIKLILSMSHSQGALSDSETHIMERTLDLADLEVNDMMRPISEIVALDLQRPLSQNMATVFSHKYSRYPVFEGPTRRAVGVIHVKDLFKVFEKQAPITTLRPFLRPILKVDADMPALELLQKFREGIPHFALVYDKKKALIGFLTMDNLLHILVGRIQDEFHRTRDDWQKNKDGTISLKGSSSLYTLERALETDIVLNPQEQDIIHTIQDLILYRLPTARKGDRLRFEDFAIEIERVDATGITHVRVHPKSKA